MSKIVRFFRDENGATAIEYGLIAAGISVAIITVVGSLGYEPQHDLHVGADRAEVRVAAVAARAICRAIARPPKLPSAGAAFRLAGR